MDSELRKRSNELAAIVFVAVLLCSSSYLYAQSSGAAPGPVSTPHGSPVLLPKAPDPVIANLLQAPAPELVIHPGDLVSIKILEIDKYEYKVRVETNGTINLPLVETVQLQGLRPDQASAAIAERLETTGMVKRPHVYVGLEEQPSQVVTVVGELQKPDVFPAASMHTLFGAISRAGGFKETASTTVTLVRPGAPEVYQIPLGSLGPQSTAGAIPVYAGDTVVVGKVGVVYVVGAVKLSGAYPLKNTSPTTVSQAIAQAGGAGFEADGKNARIVRRTENGGHLEIPIVSLKQSRTGESDQVLRADDIVFIPTNAMKAAIKGGGTGIAVSLAAAAIYR